MPRSNEIDSTEFIRNRMIERRDKALINMQFNDAVLFSHVIAALAYSIELEAKDTKQVATDSPLAAAIVVSAHSNKTR